MIIYQVLNTEKTSGFSPCLFVETITGAVYVEKPGDGFFKHPTIKSPAALKKHLDNLKTEGFKIRKTTRTV